MVTNKLKHLRVYQLISLCSCIPFAPKFSLSFSPPCGPPSLSLILCLFLLCFFLSLANFLFYEKCEDLEYLWFADCRVPPYILVHIKTLLNSRNLYISTSTLTFLLKYSSTSPSYISTPTLLLSLEVLIHSFFL